MKRPTVIWLDGTPHNCRCWTLTIARDVRTLRDVVRGLPDISLSVTLTRPWVPPDAVVYIKLTGQPQGRRRAPVFSGPAYIEALTLRKFRAHAAGSWTTA